MVEHFFAHIHCMLNKSMKEGRIWKCFPPYWFFLPYLSRADFQDFIDTRDIFSDCILTVSAVFTNNPINTEVVRNSPRLISLSHIPTKSDQRVYVLRGNWDLYALPLCPHLTPSFINLLLLFSVASLRPPGQWSNLSLPLLRHSPGSPPPLVPWFAHSYKMHTHPHTGYL